jgi:ADP-L-glycero-D-manno-heptose 6-epimerase
MRIIVTGGAGFIGSNLVRELMDRYPERSITVVDDFSSGNFRNLNFFRGDVIAHSCADMDWDYYFGGENISHIYHLASITDTTFADQQQMLLRNVEGFRRLLRFVQSRGLTVVYASSGATYGQASGVMNEEQEPDPANVYGFSKMVLDNLALEARAAGMSIRGVRYFNVYGPHEAHKGRMASMIYQLYQQMKDGKRPRVFRHGEQRRDFVYVKDAVQATLLAAECDEDTVFNVGSGQATSFNEIIDYLNSELGTDLEPDYIENPYVHFYQDHTEADLNRARQVLGYNPGWPVEDGIRDYVSWLASSG